MRIEELHEANSHKNKNKKTSTNGRKNEWIKILNFFMTTDILFLTHTHTSPTQHHTHRKVYDEIIFLKFYSIHN